MSLYCELETTMTNQEALLRALSDVGLTHEKVEVHLKPQTLYGYGRHGRPEQAEIIIRQKSVRALVYDIGFAKQKDGSYRAIISDDDLRGGYGEAWLKKVKKCYGVHTTLEWAAKHKYKVKSQVDQSGVITMTLESY